MSVIARVIGGDPFEGQAAKRRRLRLRIEGMIALTLAIVACGFSAALWIAALFPGATHLLG